MGCDYFYGVQADQFTFYRVPKLFFIQEQYRNMSTDAKLLYGMLLDRMNLSARNGCLDDLEKRFGLIERKRSGRRISNK